MIVKVNSYLKTTGNSKIKELLINPFNIVILYSDDPEILLFEKWNQVNMGNYEKLTYGNYTIKYYGNDLPYEITNNNLIGQKTFQLPCPKNIDQFISDCERCDVDLFWTQNIIDQYDLKYLMTTKEFKEYINNLLIKINKIEDSIE